MTLPLSQHSLSKTTFILHFRRDTDDRVHNLLTILKFLHTIEIGEIIIVNDDKTIDPIHKTIIETYPNVRILFLENHDEFRKSEAFNQGAKHSNNNILCFYDVDILVDPKFLEWAQNEILEGIADHVYPYNGLFIDIQKKFFPQIYAFDFSIMLTELSERHIGWSNENLAIASTNSPGGICMISKTAFDRIGGFDPHFVGWGYEDTDFICRSRKINRVKHLPDKDAICWHLHHDNAVRTENKYYQSNMQTFQNNVNRV